MIAVDTNVLLRHLVRDDPVQADLATALLDSAAERGEQVYLSTVVLSEVAWVLSTVYRLRKSDLIGVLQRILEEAGGGGKVDFVIEQETSVRRALEDYAGGRADFADYLIGRLAQASGATTTYTFDRAAAAAPTFKLLRRH